MTKSGRKRSKIKFILLLIGLNIILFSIFIYNALTFRPIFQVDNYLELAVITGQEDFQTLKEYFTDLSHEKSAIYAFEVLKKATLAPGIDTHLMAHFVGEVLYLQEGANGMQYCTDDFRNACSHTIVVGLFSEKGVGALPEITEACKKAPGGRGAYNMCFHGLGHGVLSYVGYDLKKAVGICSQIKKSREDGREAEECVGGAVMEIISGGDHDKEIWIPQNEKYMKTSDPLYPCNADFIPDESRRMCYAYLTPQLIYHAGGDVFNPKDEDYPKAFSFCNALGENDPNREVCYGNFGKDFVVLAKGRDIRNIVEMTDNEFKTVEKWCSYAGEADGVRACIISALNSLYWGGENDRQASLRFCSILGDIEHQNACHNHLIEIVNFYIDDLSYKKEFCSEIPDKYKIECQKII